MFSHVEFAPILAFVLAVFGISWALAYGKPAAPIRAVAARIHKWALAFCVCPPCSSLWIGGGICYAGFSPFEARRVLTAIAVGFLCLGFSAWISPGNGES